MRPRHGQELYVARSGNVGGSKRVTLPRRGEFSADEAGKRAGGVIDRIRRGSGAVYPDGGGLRRAEILAYAAPDTPVFDHGAADASRAFEADGS